MSLFLSPRRVVLCAFALGLSSTFSANAEQRSTTSALPAKTALPTTTETRDEMLAVCHELRTGENIVFGQSMVEALYADLNTARAARRPDIAVRAIGFLSIHLIRLNRLQEAVDLLEQARRLADIRFASETFLRRRLAAFLASAYLQLAEDENCIENHAARSCILPIHPSAVHRRTEHGRSALALYRELIDGKPDDINSRWLLNITSMLLGAYPAAVPEWARFPADSLADDPTWPTAWLNVASNLGLDPVDLAGGVVTDDFDGDGLLDVITSSWDLCAPMHAWRNTGRGFEDVTAAWGLNGQLGGLNLTQGDIDGDGDLDLLSLRGAWLGVDGRIRNSLLRNDIASSGGFVDITAAAGIAEPAYPTLTAAFADFDLDGDLDLYIGNESASKSDDPFSFITASGEPYPSQLFRNDGTDAQGVVRFTDIAPAAGVTNDRLVKGVTWGDADNDGDPDLYISNFDRNRLYRNNGSNADGVVTFTDIASIAGVTEPADMSFGTWFFDADNDGALDLFVVDYANRDAEVFAGYFGLPVRGGNPVLYRNEGVGTDGNPRFVDASTAWGLHQPLLPMGANFGDLDNDGWLDIYLGTGSPFFDAIMPNVMYRNEGGKGFRDITIPGGFGHLQKGHGIAFADLDNDGDQDIYAQTGGAFPYDAYSNVLFENPGSPRAWITLRLEGTQSNRSSIGARIAVEIVDDDGAVRSIHRTVGSGGSFGASSLQQEIGLGSASRINRLTIQWPSGGTGRYQDLAPNHVYRVVEGAQEVERLTLPTFALGSAADSASPSTPHGHASHTNASAARGQGERDR